MLKYKFLIFFNSNLAINLKKIIKNIRHNFFIKVKWENILFQQRMPFSIKFIK